MGSDLFQAVAAPVRALPFASAWLALAFAQPACAAADYAFTAGEILNPIVIISPEDMDFGEIAPHGTDDTVVLAPGATATCTATGTLIHTGTCRAASFEGSASFMFLLWVTKPVGDQIELIGPGGETMRLDNFTFAGGTGTIDAGGTATEHSFTIMNGDGSFTVYVGGTLNVAGDQQPGLYNGTFELSFNYD